MTIYVNMTNDPPEPQPDIYSTPEDTLVTIPVLANDVDPDGNNTLYVESCSSASNGAVVVVDGATVSYKPNTGFQGLDTFTCTICDNGIPSLCKESDVTVYVIASPSESPSVSSGPSSAPSLSPSLSAGPSSKPSIGRPLANDDSATTPEDVPVTIDVLDNDSDPQNDPLTVIAFTSGNNGSVSVSSEGLITYTPNPNFNGVDTFTYTISDGACVIV